MRVRELAARLLALPDQEAQVMAFDADEEGEAPVSGMVYGIGPDRTVVLQTDEIAPCDHPACWGPCGKCGSHVHEDAAGRYCPICRTV